MYVYTRPSSPPYTVYALLLVDVLFLPIFLLFGAGAMAACSAPLVGLLAENWFGFKGTSRVTGVRKDDLHNAKALGNALLAFTIGDWGGCCWGGVVGWSKWEWVQVEAASWVAAVGAAVGHRAVWSSVLAALPCGRGRERGVLPDAPRCLFVHCLTSRHTAQPHGLLPCCLSGSGRCLPSSPHFSRLILAPSFSLLSPSSHPPPPSQPPGSSASSCIPACTSPIPEIAAEQPSANATRTLENGSLERMGVSLSCCAGCLQMGCRYAFALLRLPDSCLGWLPRLAGLLPCFVSAYAL